ncbi:MAG: hypothetical protein NTY51_06425 [Deltaproteobacteria bacterium]|nr:hypothetical protein [Deltaproteobacteria bacterium]
MKIVFSFGHNRINFMEFIEKTEIIFNYSLKLICGCVKELATGPSARDNCAGITGRAHAPIQENKE